MAASVDSRASVADRIRHATSAEAILHSNRRTQLFLASYLALLTVGGIITSSYQLAFGASMATFVTTSLGNLCVQLPAWIMLFRWPRVASWFLSVSSGILITFAAWRIGEPAARTILEWNLAILTVTGFTLGARPAIGYGLFSFIALAVVTAYHVRVPASLSLPPPSRGIILIADLQVISVITTAVLIAVWSFERSLAHLQNSIASLEASKRSLETTLAELRVSEANEILLIEELKELNLGLEQRVLEKTNALRMANEDLDAFASRAAHDLRAPLRSLNGFVQLLEEDSSEFSDLLPRISRLTKRMNRLVEGILRFSKLGSKGLVLQTVDLESLVTEIFAELEGEVGGHGKLELVGRLHTVRADEELLSYALRNVISNSIKFSAKSPVPTIAISSELREEKCVVRIDDNGVGLGVIGTERLFRPFERLHGDSYEGVGLGLAMVRRIMHLHEGDIQIADSSLGGACFELCLPISS